MFWVYGRYKYFYSLSAGNDLRRQNLTSTDVRYWRLKSIPALWGINCGNIQHITLVLPGKAKRQYLLTCKVNRYFLLALQSRVGKRASVWRSYKAFIDGFHGKFDILVVIWFPNSSWFVPFGIIGWYLHFIKVADTTLWHRRARHFTWSVGFAISFIWSLNCQDCFWSVQPIYTAALDPSLPRISSNHRHVNLWWSQGPPKIFFLVWL